MSWLCDSAELVASSWLSSAYAGHGVLGANVASTGENGPSIIYPSLNLPAENADEFRALILTRPAGLTLLAIGEDGTLMAEGPDGTYVGDMRLFKNGGLVGDSTYTLRFGVAPTLSGGATLDDTGAGGGLAGGATLGGTAAGDNGQAGGGIGGGSTLAGDAAADDVQAGGGMGTGGASTLGGAAVADDSQAGGGLSSVPGATLSGTSAAGDGAAGGGMQGVAGELSGDAGTGDGSAAGAMYGAGPGPISRHQLESGVMARVVRAGRTTPTKLAPLDVSEVDDVAFDFAPAIDGVDPILAVNVTCEVRQGGVDPDAQAMRVGNPAFNADIAVQRFQAGVVGVTYLIRATATLASGRKPVAVAYLKVVRKL